MRDETEMGCSSFRRQLSLSSEGASLDKYCRYLYLDS